MTSNRKTSVVIFLPNLLVGGAEETTLRLIDYLLKKDYKINLVVATNKISDFYKIPTERCTSCTGLEPDRNASGFVIIVTCTNLRFLFNNNRRPLSIPLALF